MENKLNNNKWVKVVVVAVVIVGIGYWYSGYAYDRGYKAAVADIKAQQEETGNRAAEEAAKEANPFKLNNPLEGVEANPFEKAQKTLNPFD